MGALKTREDLLEFGARINYFPMALNCAENICEGKESWCKFAERAGELHLQQAMESAREIQKVLDGSGSPSL
jgi:hypothetical protein